MSKQFQFDEAYYRRFYEDTDSRVESDAEIASRGDFVCAYLKYLEQPVQRVLDLGCGIGHWRQIVEQHFPGVEYQGVEVSKYLCRRYGWHRASVEEYRAPEPFDLVICQGVLQYLTARSAAKAITNLNRLCAGVLYLQVMTEADWQENCDQETSDGEVYLRSGDWYRRRLSTHFINAGGGLFISRKAGAVLYELEHLDDRHTGRD